MKTIVTVTRVSNGFIFEGKNKVLVFSDGANAAENLIQDLGKSLQTMDVGKPTVITIQFEPYVAEGK
jgi:hypothetical protein